jgi:hypothetical protein
MIEVLLDTGTTSFELEKQFDPSHALGDMALHWAKCNGNGNGSGDNDGDDIPPDPFPPDPLPPPNGKPKPESN